MKELEPGSEFPGTTFTTENHPKDTTEVLVPVVLKDRDQSRHPFPLLRKRSVFPNTPSRPVPFTVYLVRKGLLPHFLFPHTRTGHPATPGTLGPEVPPSTMSGVSSGTTKTSVPKGLYRDDIVSFFPVDRCTRGGRTDGRGRPFVVWSKLRLTR